MPFNCENCDLRFPLLIGLKQHLKKHKNKSELDESASLVEQKQKQQQIENDQHKIIDLEDDDIQYVEEITSSLHCPFCDKYFINLMSFDAHVKKHSEECSSNRDESEITLSDASDNETNMMDKMEIIWSETSSQDLINGTDQKSRSRRNSVSVVSSLLAYA